MSPDHTNHSKELEGHYPIPYYKSLFLKMSDLEKVKDTRCRNYTAYITCIEEATCIPSL